MSLDFAQAESILNDALSRVAPAMQVEIRLHGKRAISRAYGWLDPETRQAPTQRATLFDLASVTKLFVVASFMTLVEEGVVSLDQAVSGVLPEFSGERPIEPYEDPLRPGAFVSVQAGPGTESEPAVDARRITFRNLLAHNSGLPAWRPLYKEGNREAAERLALATYFSYPTGARVVYSDIGLILLGMSIERLTGLRLDEVVYRRVTAPLGLLHTGYLPTSDALSGASGSPESRRAPAVEAGIAPAEVCAWRQRRIIGEVHDENAARLGGIAGHAGLFSTAADVAAFGESFLNALQPARASRRGRALLAPETVQKMTLLQAEDRATRRGLGFALWSPDPEASSNPFSRSAFGHTGFTGTSLWIDPQRSLVVAFLTNRVYYGRDARGITALRVALHRAIVQAVEKGEVRPQ